MHREEIEQLTDLVNSLLTACIKVHDGIFARPWWHNIPIPGIFKPTPFDQFEVQISKVKQLLDQIDHRVAEIYADSEPGEKSPLAVLHKYQGAHKNCGCDHSGRCWFES
jgi:hypothetical protein